MQPKEKITDHEVPLRLWEAVGADLFHFNNINYLCAVDYNSKFLIVRKLQKLSAEHLINAVSAIFTEYSIVQKLMSDAGTNFVSEKFRHFCRSTNVEQAVSLAYHNQCNGQVKACFKFIKQMFKKCIESGRDKNIALLQVHTTPIGQGLPSLVTIMFNRWVQGIMPVVDQKPIGHEHYDDYHIRLVERQRKHDNDTPPVFSNIPIGSAVAIQHEDGSLWTYGMVVGKGNHNHHGRAYVIQLTNTNNSRHISRNRCHTKPTTVMADTYIQHQSKTPSNRTADPLAEILNTINNNPALYATEWVTTTTMTSNQCEAQNNTKSGPKEADRTIP